ncbi:MAG: hypothetical protein K2P81_04640 [Bacteriovoracaceae bacterium]|nr:hypothetical protein [Bacteriovoracaceae bacterium]
MKYLWILVGIISFSALAQNLNDERIWKLASRKKAIYLSHGIFHLNQGTKSSITGIRSSNVADRGYERVVIDFAGANAPKIYGHINEGSKKISVDFFDTNVAPQISSLKNTKNVKAVDFLAIDQNQVTMELQLKSKLTFDVFYLENPARLVIDIRP